MQYSYSSKLGKKHIRKFTTHHAKRIHDIPRQHGVAKPREAYGILHNKQQWTAQST